jgi:hypothetical protein
VWRRLSTQKRPVNPRATILWTGLRFPLVCAARDEHERAKSAKPMRPAERKRVATGENPRGTSSGTVADQLTLTTTKITRLLPCRSDARVIVAEIAVNGWRVIY